MLDFMQHFAQRKVLLIGWDAADWKVINPLLDAGQMPNLKRLLEGGVAGNMATIEPILSPMLWTSIATGKRAYKHGIHGFTEVDPLTGDVRPVTTLGRKTKAIWNILTQEGKRCNVVGWWPSHPAEPINGVMVSNHFQQAVAPLEDPWPLAPGVVHPERLREPLAKLRLHPQELTHEHIGPFVPRWREVDREKDLRLHSLGKILAHCVSIHSAATAIMQLEPWDFMAVYFDAIDHFSHLFMRYQPPRCDWVPERDFEIYQHALVGGYRFHDMTLGTLLALAGEDTTVIVMSDHGFHPDHQRLRSIPIEPAGPAAEHRSFGILVIKGPGVKRQERVFGASLLDVAPTILSLFGLPAGKDMDGHPLVTIFESPPEVKTISSWDAVPGSDGSHSPNLRVDTSVGGEAIRQLVALGYIAEPAKDKQRAIEETTRDSRYNLARAFMGGNRHAVAAQILAELYATHPGLHRFGVQLAFCYKALGKARELKELVELIISRRKNEAGEGVGELRAYLKDVGEDAAKWSDEHRKEIQRLQRKAAPNLAALEFLAGVAEARLGNRLAALEYLERAGSLAATDAGLRIQMGEVYLRLNKIEAAQAAFDKALEIDPEIAAAHLGLCRCHLRRNCNFEAANEALASVGLVYFNPYGHFLLGVALARFGSFKEAKDAFQVALAQHPAFPAAHRGLARVYEKGLGDADNAVKHRNRSRELMLPGEPPQDAPPPASPVRSADAAPLVLDTTPPSAISNAAEAAALITIVSGLPRSGTSLMMQMLIAGGLPALLDDQRQPDEDNPKGYFELERAIHLERDASFLEGAAGKCVKIVSVLLGGLPAGRRYGIILMERPIEEIMTSQEKMLRRSGKKGGAIDRDSLERTFLAQMERARRCLKARGIPFLSVPYHDCLRCPEEVAKALQLFLGIPLDREAICRAVVQELYRNRAGS